MNALSLFRLEGRHALVSGAAGLLGPEFASALLEAGARVSLLDLDPAGLRQAEKRLTALYPGKVKALRCDLTSAPQVGRAVREAERWAPVDILVNAAAVNPKMDRGAASRTMGSPFTAYPEALWKKALDVNLTGLFLVTQAACRGFEKRGRGVIVNIASTYGVVAPDQRLYRGKDGRIAYKPGDYPTTKAGVIGFTRYLASYYARRGIRVNCLTPGGVLNGHAPAFQRAYAEHTLLGRMADRREYKGAVVFLSSDASSYMTGANLIVDGGWTAI